MDNARAKPGIQDNDDADPRRMPKVCKVEATDAVNDDADPQRMPKVSVEAKDEVNDDADPQRMPKACKVEEKDDDDADNPAADDIKDEAADEQDDIKDEAEDDEKGKVSEVAILLDQLTAIAEMMIETKAPDSQKKQDVDIVLRYAEQAIEEGEHVHIDCDLGKHLDRIEKEWTEILPQKAEGPTVPPWWQNFKAAAPWWQNFNKGLLGREGQTKPAAEAKPEPAGTEKRMQKLQSMQKGKQYRCQGCAEVIMQKDLSVDEFHCTQRNVWHIKCWTSKDEYKGSQICPRCKEPDDSGMRWHETCWENERRKVAIFDLKKRLQQDVCPRCNSEVKGRDFYNREREDLVQDVLE